MTSYVGIDYGMDLSNIDTETGIRFGVIPANNVSSWADASEPVYPDCDECDVKIEFVDKHDDEDEFECTYECDPISFNFTEDGYVATQSQDDTDIFITRSPFFTFAQFCSPCAPGACHLRNPVDEENIGNKCYCFDPEWFDDESPCPYKVWRVDTGELVYDPKAEIAYRELSQEKRENFDNDYNNVQNENLEGFVDIDDE